MTCAFARRLGVLVWGLLLTVAGGWAVAADGAAGDWKLSITSPEGQAFTPTLSIAGSGDKATGKFIGDDGAATDCKEVKLDGNKLLVSVSRDFGGQELSLKFDGTVSGDEVKGTVEYDLAGTVGTLDFTGQRVAAGGGSDSVAGTWNVVATTPDGQTFEPTLKLEQAGDKIGGEFIWIDGTSVKVSDVIKMGDTLSFVTNVDFGGQTLKITFSGKMQGADKVVGTAEYDLDGQTGTVDYEATRQKPAVNLAGKWNAVATTPDGQSFEPSVVLTHEGEKIGGEFIWVDGTSVPLTTGKVNGEDVTFDVSVDFGGQALVIKFAGKMTGPDSMKGSAEYDLGGQTGTVDFEAKRDTAAAQVAGFWNSVATMPDGQTFEPSVKLTQDGDKLGGEFIWIDGTSAPITTGKVTGDNVDFEVSVDFGGQALIIKFHAKSAGDTMKGSADYDLGGQTGTVEFDAKRGKEMAGAAGKWNFTIAMDDGRTIDTSLDLKDEGGKLSGKYSGPAGESDVSDAKLDGDKLSFSVKREREGREFTMKYQGAVSGDEVKGDVEFDFGEQNGKVPFTGKRAK